MLQAEPDAGSAAPQALLTRPPGEHRGAPDVVITVLIFAATLAIAVFVALVVVPSVGAAGGCGGGWQFLHFAKQNRRCSRSSSARRTRRWAG